MKIKLFIQAVIKYFLGVLIVGLMIFLPAGTINYRNGWIFMIILFVPMFLAGIIMLIKNPELLKSRLDLKERQKNQENIVKLSGIMFIIGFIIAGLSYRYKWFVLSDTVSIIASIVFLISYLLYAEVLRENTFLSRTIEVKENQKVIDTGLYSIVRHPMYLSTLLLFLSMPLVLGSLLSFIVFLIYPLIIIKRIKYEEEFLENNLKGYKEYKKKVKYKLIPYIY